MGYLRGELYVMFSLVYLCFNDYIADPPIHQFLGDYDSSNLKHAITITMDPEDVTGDLEVPNADFHFAILNTVEKTTTVEVNEVEIIEPASIENYPTYTSIAALQRLNSPTNKVKDNNQAMTVDRTKVKNEARIDTESSSLDLKMVSVAQQTNPTGGVTLCSANDDRWINTDELQKNIAASLRAKRWCFRRNSA